MRGFWFLVGVAAMLGVGCTSGSSASDGGPTASDAGGTHDAGGGNVPDSGLASDGGCPQLLTWGNSGGLGAYSESSQVTGCQDFTLTRTPAGDPTASGSCQAQLDAGLTQELDAALADSDVVAALQAAPVIYGIDPRPADGVVFEFVADGKRVDVGDPCGGQSGCLEIPAGVSSLATDLKAITEQVRATEPTCAPLR